jgi:hypothetical protein
LMNLKNYNLKKLKNYYLILRFSFELLIHTQIYYLLIMSY